MAEQGNNSRLEAFSDGVFAIALTLLVNPKDVSMAADFTLKDLDGVWHCSIGGERKGVGGFGGRSG